MATTRNLPGVYAMPGIRANTQRISVEPMKLLLDLCMKAAHVHGWPADAGRRRKHLHPRALFWWACANVLHKPYVPTLKAQGRFVPGWNYDHTTVMYWHRTWANDLETGFADAVQITERFMGLLADIRASHKYDLKAFKSIHDIPGYTPNTTHS